ncbi:MAG: hypothetical protein H7Z12_17995 [Rhodospirillaceae bacterium]|nr:hypothetical protein [Rhodospirillales bacterium]
MSGTVSLIVNHADNELMAFLNGALVYDRKTEGNPGLNDQVQLQGLMQAGSNVLVLVGVNWGGPATFDGRIEASGNIVIPFSYTAASTPNGMCWNQTFNLTY